MTSADPTATPVRATTRKRGGFFARFSLAVALVLVVALVIFVLQNTVHTRINFIGWNFDLAQGVWLLGAAAVGSVITLAIVTALCVRRAVR